MSTIRNGALAARYTGLRALLPVPRAKLQEGEGDNRMALRRGTCTGFGEKAHGKRPYGAENG